MKKELLIQKNVENRELLLAAISKAENRNEIESCLEDYENSSLELSMINNQKENYTRRQLIDLIDQILQHNDKTLIQSAFDDLTYINKLAE